MPDWLQALVEEAVNPPSADSDQQQQGPDAARLEQQLCRLEDAVLLLAAEVPALLLEEGVEDDTLRDALGSGSAAGRMLRLAGSQRSSELKRRLLTYRCVREVLHEQAATVLQRAWSRYRDREGVMQQQ